MWALQHKYLTKTSYLVTAGEHLNLDNTTTEADKAMLFDTEREAADFLDRKELEHRALALTYQVSAVLVSYLIQIQRPLCVEAVWIGSEYTGYKKGYVYDIEIGFDNTTGFAAYSSPKVRIDPMARTCMCENVQSFQYENYGEFIKRWMVLKEIDNRPTSNYPYLYKGHNE